MRRAGLVSAALLFAIGMCVPAARTAQAAQAEDYKFGVAKVDITPDHPVRLSGFGFRRTESEGVTHRIWAKALVIDDGSPAVLVTIDACIIPYELTKELAARLQKKANLRPERLAVTITHTHTAPMIKGTVPTLFGVPIPKEHAERVDRYTAELLDKLEQVCLAAMADRKPAKLSWGIGSVGFALNRRTKGGPVDHDLPVLVVKDLQGKVRAVWTNYACHCVTLSNNKISGDWAGYAQEAIEDEFRGAIALVAIGCGADQNPNSGVTGDKWEVAQRQGIEIAKEVKRLTTTPLTPISGQLNCATSELELPLGVLPTKADWEERANRNDAIGHHARVQLERLQRGEQQKTSIPYLVQTWSFGNSLGMVFLPGEVVVDYALRLKRELDGRRVWINAYANACPCYIPSERILKEGGYEGVSAMTYYDLPAPLEAGLEVKIVAAVHVQLGQRFKSPFDSNKLGGTRPLSPQQSLKLIQVKKELVVDLVAAEPLVTSPVAIDWGPDGKLYVAEMFDYPQGPNADFKPGGRVRVLEDLDGDWKYDKATVFLENIPFPTGVTAWRKGVLVCAAPDILYAEDTDGDGKADVVKKLFSGFGTHNYQGRVNSLEHGLDGWVYGSCGLFGGAITCRPLLAPLSPRGGERPGVRGEHIIQLGDRDFRIKPDEGLLEPATGRTQQGRVRDDWGNWFGCDSGTLCRHYPLMDHYLRRNPHYAATDTVVHVPQSQKLFPLNPNLQLFKLSGPAGVPTAACGLGIYRDSFLGEEYRGNAFVCEPVNLLVHRMKLVPKGSTFIGVRPEDEQTSEFLASTDPWFRPVQARTGPDGCLWVVDMYRFVIEHPQWIPPADLAKLDLRAGSTMGRIYRVRPKDAQVRAMPNLARRDAGGLVSALHSDNGWQRDTATHLLLANYELGTPVGAEAYLALYHTANKGTNPLARLHALCVLEANRKLDYGTHRRVLDSRVPGLRRHGLRFLESLLRGPGPTPSAGAGKRLVTSVEGFANDEDPQVRLQLALSLGTLQEPEAGKLLATLAELYPNDRHLLAAVLSSVNKDNVASAIERILVLPHPPEQVLTPLIRLVVRLGKTDRLGPLLSRLAAPAGESQQPWKYLALACLLEELSALPRGEGTLTAERHRFIEMIVAGARSEAARLESAAPTPLALAALELLGRDERMRGQDVELLLTLVTAKQPAEVQTGALAALSRIADAATARGLIQTWANLAPTLKPLTIDLLLSRTAWQTLLLEALERKQIPAAQIDATRRQRLLQHKDPKMRTLAARVFDGASNPDRQRVVNQFADVASLAGDPARGKLLFAKACSACHLLDGVGHDIAPNLAALQNKSPGYLLQEILDPNKNVDSRYVEYIALTKVGRTVTGMLASETATSLTLRGQEAKQETLLRTDIEELQSTGKSLMPEGLEKDLSKENLADLIAYLGKNSGGTVPVSVPRVFPGNRPEPVQPVDGRLVLLATQAEIHGVEIAFEEPFKNLGMWHGADDRATWTVLVEKAGDYDLYLDWSCDDTSANNPFVLEGDKPLLRGKVPSTGGWDKYRQDRLGTITLAVGQQRLTFRPDGVKPQWALIDLRGIQLVPKGQKPAFAVLDVKADSAELARQILDDRLPAEQRQALINQHSTLSAELLTAMTADLKPGTPEEYRRIPWIWRVSVAAGRRNDAEELAKLLEVSLPKPGAPLRDWQAVVIGGGIINGISLQGQWPLQRIAELLRDRVTLRQRWEAIFPAAHGMADNERTPTGTRYDALRIIPLDAWEKCGERLARYLAKGTHDELTMGAICGLSDVDRPEVAALLLKHLDHFSAGNRKLAVEALLRTEGRTTALLDALEKGGAKPAWLAAEHVKALRSHKNETIRKRAEKLLPG